MKLNCPHGCGAEFSMSETTCPSCRKPVGAVDIVKLNFQTAWYGFWGGKDRVFTVDCPQCMQGVPISDDTCPSCGTDVSFVAILNEHMQPLVSVLAKIRDKLDRATPGEANAIRIGYFVASLAVLGILINAAEAKFVNGNGNWISAALAAAVYLGTSLMVLTWIVPRNIASVLVRLKVLIKLSFFVNYLSTVFVILLVTDHWRVRSWLLIGTLFTSIVGVWFASIILLPAWVRAGAVISGQTTNAKPTLPKEIIRGPTSERRPRTLT